MKIEIENIKNVYWKLKALADNLFIYNEDEALEICAEHTDSYKFTNTHHKAKQEVEYLALNKNYSLLNSYYKKYKYCLDDIKETCSKYDNKSLRTQVNIYLIPTLEVFDEIKEHVTLDELKNQTKTLDDPQLNQIEEKQEAPAEHLKDLFKDKNLYDKVIDILIDENYIEKGTLIWKDETNGRNTFVAGLVKVLYNKGYLSRSAKNREIPFISKNTFNVVLSQSIAEKTKVNDNDAIYKFIPIVTELKEK